MSKPKPDITPFLNALPSVVSLRYARMEEKDEYDASGAPLPKKIVLVFSFSEKGRGFGEFAIVQTDEGVFVDTEHDGIEQVKTYLSQLLDGAITDVDTDPEKHALYCRVMRQTCGPACLGCNHEGT
jgi:hypothetical protein